MESVKGELFGVESVETESVDSAPGALGTPIFVFEACTVLVIVLVEVSTIVIFACTVIEEFAVVDELSHK
jgi:hypothetical protein